jgi:hypothetical protein
VRLSSRALKGLAAAVTLLGILGALVITQNRNAHDPLLYYLYLDDARQNAKRTALQDAAIARQTQQCMASHGLRYVLSDADLADASPGVNELSPEAYAHAYGFGITIEPPTESADIADPNSAYAESLSTSDRVAYLTALLGSSSGGSGCLATARNTVLGLRENPLHDAAAVLDDLKRRTANDSRFGELEFDWTSCASSAGAAVDRKNLTAFVTQHFTTALAAVKALPEAKRSAALDALQREEKAMAVSVMDCNEKLRTREGPIMAEIAADWARDHRAELVNLRKRLEQADATLESLANDSATPAS